MKRVIVTGANGFIGSSFIKKLVKEGIKVVAIDVTFAHSHLPVSPLITTIETSIDRDLVSIIPTLDYDAFYHFAWRGVNGEEKADPIVQIENVRMAIVCAMICKKIDCKRLLCAGTIAEQSINSLSSLAKVSGGMLYGVGKHCTHLFLEAYCKNIGIEFVWLQFSNIYGIGNLTGNLVSYTLMEIIAGREATFGPALQPYDFIYIDDLIEAVYRLGDANITQNTYFIGSDTPHLLKDYLTRIGELVFHPDKIKIGVRTDDGIRYDMSMFDIAPLVQDIGEYVKCPFDEGIIKTYQWINDTH